VDTSVTSSRIAARSKAQEQAHQQYLEKRGRSSCTSALRAAATA
jgi:hypothetical protein